MRHPDYLNLSRSQYLGWMAWMAVRGPIGPQRQDFYAAIVSMYAGKPYDQDKDPPELKDFLAQMPGYMPPPVDEDED